MMSVTSELTIPANAAPMMTPIAKSMTLPLRANSLNSWTIFSGGWCFLLLAGFYVLIDVLGYRRWSFPLVVIGLNSIAIYVLSHLIDRFIIASFRIHFGQNVFNVFGEGYSWLLSGGVVIIVFWLMLYWMYRRRIFIRI